MFPQEIYERIFYYTDGKTLLAMKCVCKHFKTIVEYLENKYNIWERSCKNELAKTSLHVMKDKCGYVDDLKHKWKVIFKNYHSWQNLKSKKYYVLQKQSIDYFENNITCAKLSGSRIMYGNISGIICIVNDEYEVEDVVISDVRGNLKDIIFLNELENKEISAYNHSHVIAVYERYLILYKLEPKIEQVLCVPQIEHVSVYNDIVAYSDRDGICKVAQICFNEPPILTQICYCRVFSPSKIMSLCIYENRVMMITQADVLTFDYKATSIVQAFVATKVQMLMFPSEIIERYWTFQNEIVFCTSSIFLYLTTIQSVGKDCVTRSFNCMQTLQSPICDIMLYGNVLILTLLNGKVYIYVVDDWSELDLENFDMKINVYGEPICSIDVQELENEHRLLLTMNDYITQVFIF